MADLDPLTLLPILPKVPPEWHLRHQGHPAFILGNGSSILSQDLTLIPPAYIIGCNRSWQLPPWPDYHVVADTVHLENHPEVYWQLSKESKLFKLGRAGGEPFDDCGFSIPILPFPLTKSFPRDLLKGGAVSQGRQGSVCYLALQVAVWLGFNPIFFLGLDLGGEHFHREWPTYAQILEQDILYQEAANSLPDHAIYNCSPITKSKVFPYLPYEEALVMTRPHP